VPVRADPLDLRSALQRVAAPQGGYFTAQQALEAGYSYPAQHYHANRGAWERIDRGIYRLRDWPLPDHPDLVRWALWSRGAGVVSHGSALAAHELGDFMPSAVHLTVPPGTRRRAPGVVLHEAELPGSDIEAREGFHITTPERSLLDTASSNVQIDQLATAIDDAITRGLTSAARLRARSDELGPATALAIERALAAL
jgi:predicted transcriptional regulator of viral defense system